MRLDDRPRQFSFRRAGLALVTGILSLLAGCATGPGENDGRKIIFFPPPPAAPRVQYLTSFSGGLDPDSVSGKFATFVIGQEESVAAILKPYGVAIAATSFSSATPARGRWTFWIWSN